MPGYGALWAFSGIIDEKVALAFDYPKN